MRARTYKLNAIALIHLLLYLYYEKPSLFHALFCTFIITVTVYILLWDPIARNRLEQFSEPISVWYKIDIEPYTLWLVYSQRYRNTLTTMYIRMHDKTIDGSKNL